VTVNQATNHLKNTLGKSNWPVIRGWHVFRHSFISNCATRGIDQRIIDTWVGHQTDAMRRRYTHLLPNVQQAAMTTVFGSD
jgi:integrase